MGWPNNNRYWKNYSPGAPMKFTVETLWAKFKEYIEDNDKQYWEKPDFIKSGPGAGTEVYLKVPNPPSITGFCCFAGITPQTFYDYRKSGHDLSETSAYIVSIIQTIQVDGASTNIFNANIVARLANLIDKKEIDIKTEMSDDERNEMIKNILEKTK